MNDEWKYQLAALYRDQAIEEPPARLDKFILKAARRKAWWQRNGWKAASATGLIVIAGLMALLPDKQETLSIAASQTNARIYLLGGNDSARVTRALRTLRPQQSAINTNSTPGSQKDFLR